MNLKNLTENFESKTGGRVAVYLKDLNSGFEFGYKEDQVFTAASLAKVFIGALVEDLSNKGKLNLNNKVSVKNKVGGSGIINELLETEFFVSDLLELSISMSDNSAANQLIDSVGGAEMVESYLKECGLKKSKFSHKFMLFEGKGENLSTAEDLGVFLQRLVTKEKAYPHLLKAMEHQKDQLRIPFYLKYKVLNKTGTLPDPDSCLHDAAIIKKESGPVIFVILTQEVVNRKETVLNMQQFASDALNLIKGKK